MQAKNIKTTVVVELEISSRELELAIEMMRAGFEECYVKYSNSEKHKQVLNAFEIVWSGLEEETL